MLHDRDTEGADHRFWYNRKTGASEWVTGEPLQAQKKWSSRPGTPVLRPMSAQERAIFAKKRLLDPAQLEELSSLGTLTPKNLTPRGATGADSPDVAKIHEEPEHGVAAGGRGEDGNEVQREEEGEENEEEEDEENEEEARALLLQSQERQKNEYWEITDVEGAGDHIDTDMNMGMDGGAPGGALDDQSQSVVGEGDALDHDQNQENYGERVEGDEVGDEIGTTDATKPFMTQNNEAALPSSSASASALASAPVVVYEGADPPDGHSSSQGVSSPQAVAYRRGTEEAMETQKAKVEAQARAQAEFSSMMEGGDSDPYANPNPANLPSVLGAPGLMNVDTTDLVGQALLAALTEGDEDTALRCISQAGSAVR